MTASQLVRRTEIHQVLARLSPEQRKAVTLHYWDNLTCVEIAVKLGITRRYARRLISKSLAEIRTSWGIHLPERPNKAMPSTIGFDPWWPLVLESLRRHVEAPHFGTDEDQLLLADQFRGYNTHHSE